VVDYGCGSGVLAIAAALLAAPDVLAVDIDQQAIEATRQNAADNGVDMVIKAVLSSQLPSSTVDLLPLAGEVVFANILHGPLLDLAQTLSSLTKPGGTLVMSGILQSQVESLAVSYNQWFTLHPTVVRDDWALVVATRVTDSY